MWIYRLRGGTPSHRLKSLPSLQYLGIGCWALEGDDPAMFLQHSTLDIHFLEAPNHILERLGSTQDVQLTATGTPNWKHYHLLKSGCKQRNPIETFPPVAYLHSFMTKAEHRQRIQDAEAFHDWLLENLCKWA